MDELPYIIEIILALDTDGGSRVKESNLELKARETDLFLTSASKVMIRGKLYRLMDTGNSDINFLDTKGNPYRMLKYRKD